MDRITSIGVLKRARCERAATRYAERRKKEQTLTALSLPFEEAFNHIRRAAADDYRVVFYPEVVKWCQRHADAIMATGKLKTGNLGGNNAP